MINRSTTNITLTLKTKMKQISFISLASTEKKRKKDHRLSITSTRRTTILIFLRCHGTRCSFIVTGADGIESGLDFLYPRRSRPALRFHCNTHGFSIERYR